MKQDFDLAAILQGEYAELIVKGIEMTLQLALFAWLLAMVLALTLVTVRLTGNKLVDRLVAGYVSYHRNVPTLVQLMLWYFGVPTLLNESTQLWLANHNTEYLFSVIALGLCQAAYFCEDIRSGLRAMRYVILPQGVRNCLPSLINHTVLLFKNTSLAMAIGVMELTYATREVENYTFRTFESYLVATVFYLVFSLLLMGVGALLARHFSKAMAR